MVNFQQLKNMNVETVQTQIDGWITASTTMSSLKNAANSQVGNTISNGTWSGRSGLSAANRASNLGEYLGDAKTEADSVKWLLWTFKKSAKGVQDRLNDTLARAEKDSRVEITSEGVARIKPSQQDPNSPAKIAEAKEAQKVADWLNWRIKAILAEANSLDQQLTAKLKAAAKVDGPPRFNGDAPTDGYILTQGELGGKYDIKDEHGNIKRFSYEGIGKSTWGIFAGSLQGGGGYKELVNIENRANEIADARFGAGANYNGQGDAMKHALGAALLSREFGEGNARLITDGHEGPPDNPRHEEIMDLKNNEIGYRIARDNPNASDKQLADLIEKEVRAGNLLTVDNNVANSGARTTGAITYSDGRAIPK